MANRWGKSGNSDKFYFLWLQNHCERWLQPWNKTLASGKKSYHKPRQHIKKQRHHFTNKSPYSQSSSFSSSYVPMWQLDIKKAEFWRTDVFKLWWWRRLLRVPWTARRSNQSILKEISPEYSLEGLMLKLKLQYFGHLMWRSDSLEKTLMLGKIEGGRRRGQQRMRWLDGITNSMDMSLSKLREWRWTGKPGVLQSMGTQRVDTIERLNWTVAMLSQCLEATCGRYSPGLNVV